MGWVIKRFVVVVVVAVVVVVCVCVCVCECVHVHKCTDTNIITKLYAESYHIKDSPQLHKRITYCNMSSFFLDKNSFKSLLDIDLLGCEDRALWLC